MKIWENHSHQFFHSSCSVWKVCSNPSFLPMLYIWWGCKPGRRGQPCSDLYAEVQQKHQTIYVPTIFWISFWMLSYNSRKHTGSINVLFLSTSGSTGGGSDRAGDIKDVLDIEHLQLNDQTNKANKTQVCLQSALRAKQLTWWEYTKL